MNKNIWHSVRNASLGKVVTERRIPNGMRGGEWTLVLPKDAFLWNACRQNQVCQFNGIVVRKTVPECHFGGVEKILTIDKGDNS